MSFNDNSSINRSHDGATFTPRPVQICRDVRFVEFLCLIRDLRSCLWRWCLFERMMNYGSTSAECKMLKLLLAMRAGVFFGCSSLFMWNCFRHWLTSYRSVLGGH